MSLISSMPVNSFLKFVLKGEILKDGSSDVRNKGS